MDINIEDKRELAIKRLKAKNDFKAHLLAYVVFNTMVIVIWALAGGGFFWPIFLICGWGIGVVINGYTAYFGERYTEKEIRREMEHLT